MMKKNNVEEIKMDFNLKVGEILIGKELMKKFGFKENVTGKQKKLQMETIQRYVKLEQQNDMRYKPYKIVEVYDKPLPKEDKRKDNGKDVYKTLFRILILMYLYSCQKKEDSVFFMTSKEIGLKVGLISSKYNWLKKKVNENKHSKEIEILTGKYFCSTIDLKLRDVIRGCLKTLNRQASLYSDFVYVCTENRDITTNDYTAGRRELTNEEVKIYTRCMENVLKEINYRDEQSVILYGNVDEFYSKVLNKFREAINNDKVFVFKAYKIILSGNYEIGIQKNMDELTGMIKNINSNFYNTLEVYFNNRTDYPSLNGFDAKEVFIKKMMNMLNEFVKLEEHITIENTYNIPSIKEILENFDCEVHN